MWYSTTVRRRSAPGQEDARKVGATRAWCRQQAVLPLSYMWQGGRAPFHQIRSSWQDKRFSHMLSYFQQGDQSPVLALHCCRSERDAEQPAVACSRCMTCPVSTCQQPTCPSRPT